MVDNTSPTPAPAAKVEKLERLRPTLFIGVGGTGMEVLMRVRRQILNALWGPPANRLQVESLAEFPVAQFINFDLDSGSVIESGRSQKDDPLYELVKFSDEERIVESFDIEKYSRDDDSLGRFPHVQAWSPLTPKRIRELGIDPSKGAGQIRAISRLYFFDKYPKVRDLIRQKLRALKSGLSKDAQLKRLGLTLAQDKFQIIVVGSVAGGTGAGCFLDMGWLASWIAREELPAAESTLAMLMPSGFHTAGKDRTEANGYAALMELETMMRGNAAGRYLTRWDPYDKPQLPTKPYDEVYLVDSGNVAQQHTSDIKDVYQMVADALFEDFASADFANRKRSIAVNQRQHKIVPLSPPVTVGRYGHMKLTYFKGYSAFGQAVLDTQQEGKRLMRAQVWAGEMLKAFFGVAAADTGTNRATDKQRDSFVADQLLLAPSPFGDFPEFSSRNVELKRSSGEFTDYRVVEELLKDNNGHLLGGVQQKVDGQIEAIKASFKRDEWVAQVREAVRQLERDSIRDQDSTADTTEDRVARQRQRLFEQIKTSVRAQLYSYLDNKQFGGLEYVLSLVEQTKDRLANNATGLIAALNLNAARYDEIKDAVRTHEYERLMTNLGQTSGGLNLFGNSEKQSVTIMDQLKTEVANVLKFHLRAKAASEAARLMSELSRWLGERSGVDAQGRAQWTGLVGEFQAGRDSVMAMLATLSRSIETLRQDLKKTHATYIPIEAPEREVALPRAETLRDWADEAFQDIGGSKLLFPMLANADERPALLAKVRRMAERQIALAGDAADAREADPLFAALDAMSPAERQRRFSELLTRAMPWIDANLSREYTPNADQFKCFIGVRDANGFEKRFRDQIDAAIPTQSGITAAQLGIVETGVAGRAVCYCELSGIPLTVLRGLEAWRASYRKESEKIPVHTHVDSTQFAHPLVPSMDELNGLADDFKGYLLAVMLGVLTRSSQRVVPPGQYQFSVGRGEFLKMGNERAFRLNGLPVTYRAQIVDQAEERLDALDRTPLAALAALAALAGYYETVVYAPRLVPDETGAETPRKGFASAIAGELARELSDRALRRGFSLAELAGFEQRALERLSAWASPIEGSDGDAYDWEVRAAEPDQAARLKYALRPEFIADARWAEAALAAGGAGPRAGGSGAAGATGAFGPAAGSTFGSAAGSTFGSGDRAAGAGTSFAPAAAGAAGVPPSLPMQAPPLPASAVPPSTLYMVAIHQQQAGPYTVAHLQQFIAAGQIDADTLVWRQGLPQWLPLGQLAELAMLVGAPPLPGLGAPPLPGDR